MVKTTRQIKTEEDRFGGYIPRTESGRRNVEVDLNVDPDTELSFSRRTFVEPEYHETKTEPAKEESIYSTLDKPRRTVNPPVRKPAATKRAAEDVMPSIRTREEPDRATETQPYGKSSGLLGSRAKVLLAVYVTVAVILAAIVIATGIVLSTSSSAVASLEQAVEARNAVIAEQNAEILNLENDTMLSGMAVENGMSSVSSVTEFDLLPVYEPAQITETTNWFDKFCDWLGKIL